MKYLTSLLIILFVVCFSQQSSAQFPAEQQQQIDSLNHIIDNPASPDTSLASAYVELSGILYVSNIDTIVYLCKKTESIATRCLKKTKNKLEILALRKSLGSALSNIGYFHQQKGEVEKALEYYHKSLKMQEALGIKEGVGVNLNNIAGIYDSQGKIEKALEYYYKSLKIQEEIGNKIGVGASLINIGFVYDSQGKNEKALEYYHKSLKIQEELGNKRAVALIYNNLGSIYKQQDDSEKALELYNKSLKTREEIDDESGIAGSLNNIGIIYHNQHENEKALEYYYKSLKIREKLGDQFGTSVNLMSIGTAYFDLGQLKKAQEYATKAHVLTNNLGFPKSIKTSSGLLYKIAQKQGNYQEAFNMYQLHIKMRDSLNNEETYKASIEQNAKYEYEKQAAADSIVAAEGEKVHLANLAVEQLKVETQKKQKWYLYIGLGLVALFGAFMFNRFRITKKQKNIIDTQKQEVEKQKVTVEKTLGELKTTYEQLEESHKEITDSINYAERIQRSFLASKETLDTNLKDYFVFFKPKEAVSGDFYWAAQLNNNNFAFSVADSTGHGVPGAIMSLLNITSLEKSVETETEPHTILNKTREIIVERLSKDGSASGGKDGMDCNLMVLNQDTSVLTFASANNTIFIIRDGEILEYKGDKMPVGKHDRDNVSFTLQQVQLQKGDVLYALTDGFQDQFGGPKGKKYMIKRLKNKFIEIAKLPMKEQEKTLVTEFTDWMAANEQIDDVCVIGVRF